MKSENDYLNCLVRKIKNEIFGDEYIALEVFPRESELVDEANMYHLWVFKNTKLSFSLKE